jgi:amidase
MVPLSPRQDTAGPMARSAADAAVLMSAIGEQPLRFGESSASLEAFRLRGLRIGVVEPSRAAHPATLRCFEEARRTFEREGAVLVPVQEPAALRSSRRGGDHRAALRVQRFFEPLYGRARSGKGCRRVRCAT